MRNYTKKGIKNTVKTGMAEDITNYNFNRMKDFLHSHNIEKIGVSTGMYGVNAALLQDRNTGNFYAITERNSTLMMAI